MAANRGLGGTATMVALIAALSGCRGRGETAVPTVIPAEGISVAIYTHGGSGWATIDDRRMIEVAGGSILLDRIDPAAPLPSLVIEPLVADRRALTIVACVRERLVPETPPAPRAAVRTPIVPVAVVPEVKDEPKPAPPAARPSLLANVSPIVRCTVRGRPGKYLVRVLHVAPIAPGRGLLRYRAQTEVGVAAGERATVSTRYAITTPPWHVRVDVALYDGTPGKEVPPVELARGAIDLDGGTALLALPAKELPAKLRRVFDGGVRTDGVESKDAAWRKDSHQAVWVHLELEGDVPPGPVHVHHEAEPEHGGPLVVRDVDIGALVRRRIGTTVRLPLYIDDTLRGFRQHWVDRADGTSLTDRFQLSVSNLGLEGREVWIEEQLRTARHREVVRARPAKPAVGREVTRTAVTVGPQSTERVSYTVNYEF